MGFIPLFFLCRILVCHVAFATNNVSKKKKRGLFLIFCLGSIVPGFNPPQILLPSPRGASGPLVALGIIGYDCRPIFTVVTPCSCSNTTLYVQNYELGLGK